jgi:hypothetical protein
VAPSRLSCALGEFTHALLVGMFGSGQIAAFNPIDGSFLGLMKEAIDSTHRTDSPLVIEGLSAKPTNPKRDLRSAWRRYIPNALLGITCGPRQAQSCEIVRIET